MPACLQSLSDRPSILIDKPVIFIGRDSECDVVLENSRRVSRKHCCVAHVNNRLVVRDLGSMNGVWINGQRVERTGEMRPGDELAIGDVRFKLTTEEPQNLVGGGNQGDADETDSPWTGNVIAPSHDNPVIIESRDENLEMAESASADGLPELPRLPLTDDEDGDVIPLADDDDYNDGDSSVLPLSG
tara:strand:- start:1557 stop:2117 length:561 start_codon:yes stop_codon:yes gene_type:complete